MVGVGYYWLAQTNEVKSSVFYLVAESEKLLSPHKHQSLQSTESCFRNHFCGSWLLGRGRQLKGGNLGRADGSSELLSTPHCSWECSEHQCNTFAEDASLRASTWVLQCEPPYPCALDVDLWQHTRQHSIPKCSRTTGTAESDYSVNFLYKAKSRKVVTAKRMQ